MLFRVLEKWLDTVCVRAAIGAVRREVVADIVALVAAAVAFRPAGAGQGGHVVFVAFDEVRFVELDVSHNAITLPRGAVFVNNYFSIFFGADFRAAQQCMELIPTCSARGIAHAGVGR